VAGSHELKRFADNGCHTYYTEIKYLYKYLYRRACLASNGPTKSPGRGYQSQ
jgi:hypothetical protein